MKCRADRLLDAALLLGAVPGVHQLGRRRPLRLYKERVSPGFLSLKPASLSLSTNHSYPPTVKSAQLGRQQGSLSPIILGNSLEQRLTFRRLSGLTR